MAAFTHRALGAAFGAGLLSLAAGPAAAAVIATYSGALTPFAFLDFELPQVPGEYVVKISATQPMIGEVEMDVLFRQVTVDAEGDVVLDEEFFVDASGLEAFEARSWLGRYLISGPLVVALPGGLVLTETTRTFLDISLQVADEDIGATYLVTVASVPEPQAWVTMICGFGLLGAAARRRRSALRA